ncbi:uncharacterized protein K460DRAFT_368124 [Cucurbitaria berberidis CBS 394.84]|uniref:Uncharacterized protein n=1 Tax=Cucurbitaria berberidis CBS 394.84 TaxID=1168544 RepID=A0A9P4GC91_9PLEO|nr:uncharacterized protein K460DRAFT_368124 [Cucurbitaria berberidis CBS 394.84]KAF1843213.1 hypothetical protein K460DRAFT_368124 [Cucurbitaria berberidis CBS 394.84]
MGLFLAVKPTIHNTNSIAAPTPTQNSKSCVSPASYPHNPPSLCALPKQSKTLQTSKPQPLL